MRRALILSISSISSALSLAACVSPAPAVPPPAVAPPPAASGSAPGSAAAAPAAVGSIVADMRKEARAFAPLVKTALVKAFLAGVDDLPAQPPRRLWHDAGKKRYWTDAEAARLPDAERRVLTPEDADEELYYVARFGTPVAYARTLEVLGLGREALAGKRVLDFGFGAPGQLRIMAALGAHVTGIEVDPLSRALYTAPGDQGAIHGRLGPDGDLRLLFGLFPTDPALRQAVGAGYDLFISKNVLKRGYLHPERFASEKHLISLGVDDETFVRTLHDILAPGGKALIYNLAPPPAPLDAPYIPWADGRCPFAREVWEKLGFRVVAFDRDDTPAAHAMAHALGWDREEGQGELFATYTLVEKPER